MWFQFGTTRLYTQAFAVFFPLLFAWLTSTWPSGLSFDVISSWLHILISWPWAGCPFYVHLEHLGYESCYFSALWLPVYLPEVFEGTESWSLLLCQHLPLCLAYTYTESAQNILTEPNTPWSFNGNVKKKKNPVHTISKIITISFHQQIFILLSTEVTNVDEASKLCYFQT